MPSSTSSSEFPSHRAPARQWGLIWLMSVIVAATLASGVEMLWRSKGYRPTITDSASVWSSYRVQVSDQNRKHIALLGFSRIQLGISTETLRQALPGYEVTQLAVAGRRPVATLRDLANDSKFCGIVICDITADGLERSNWDQQQDYVDYYHNQNLLNIINEAPYRFLQRHLVLLSPHWRLDHIVRSLITRRSLPEPPYQIMNPDRSLAADFTKVDIKAYRQETLQRFHSEVADDQPSPPDEWMKDVQDVETLVGRIQTRGGRVIFVRFPSSDERWEAEQQRYPRDQYWDRMAAITSAETIHFTDVPSLNRFDTPDASHLDYRDAPAFTKALIEELIDRRAITTR